MKALSLVFLLLLSGCGASFVGTSRQVIYGAGITVTQVDQAVAPAYGKAAQEALAASQSLAEYEERMHDWNVLEEALRGTWEALKAVEAALDAYVAGSEGDVLRAVLAVVAALRHLAEALEPVLPQEVDQVVDLVGGLVEFVRQPGGDER